MKFTKDNTQFFGTAVEDSVRPALIEKANELFQADPNVAGAPFELDAEGQTITGYITFASSKCRVEVKTAGKKAAAKSAVKKAAAKKAAPARPTRKSSRK